MGLYTGKMFLKIYIQNRTLYECEIWTWVSVIEKEKHSKCVITERRSRIYKITNEQVIKKTILTNLKKERKIWKIWVLTENRKKPTDQNIEDQKEKEDKMRNQTYVFILSQKIKKMFFFKLLT